MELSQTMKDFIAYSMTDRDWREIAKEKLTPETEPRILHDHNRLYDKSYFVVTELTSQGKVSKWSDMKIVLNSVNKEIVHKFTKRFSEKAVPG